MCGIMVHISGWSDRRLGTHHHTLAPQCWKCPACRWRGTVELQEMTPTGGWFRINFVSCFGRGTPLS